LKTLVLTEKAVDSLDIEGWHMLFLLVLKGLKILVLAEKLLILLILKGGTCCFSWY